MAFILLIMSAFCMYGAEVTKEIVELREKPHHQSRPLSCTTSELSVCDSEQTMSKKRSLVDALGKSARAKGPLAIGKALGMHYLGINYLTAEESLQIVTDIFLRKNIFETLNCLLDDNERANAQAAAVDFLDRNVEGTESDAPDLWQDCVRIVKQSFAEMGKKIAALKTASTSKTSEESFLDLYGSTLNCVAKIASFLHMAEQVRTAKNDFMAQVCLSNLKNHSRKSDKAEEEEYLASLKQYSLIEVF